MENKKPIPITENENKDIIKQWFKDAAKQTPDTIAEFINHVMNDYAHDYGTVCNAVAASAVAAAWAANATEQGGITGFQAGAVMWRFIQNWNRTGNRTGMCLVDYDDMLYPQYSDRFDKTISPDIWEAIQEEAKKHLQEEVNDGHLVHPEVKAHWQSIVNGQIPFGYKLKQKG